MNYRRIYNQIIERRKIETPNGYSEKHHILPRSFGGSDEKENLVSLTAREHFLCHYLLIKMSIGTSNFYKAIHAFMMMQCSGKNVKRERLTLRAFEKYRIEYSKIMSSSQIGDNNSQFGTKWIHNLQLEESKKIRMDQEIPEGWLPGRVIDFNLKKQKVERAIQEKIARENKKEMTVEQFRSWFKIYDDVGFEEFVKMTGYDKSHPALVYGFSKYLPEFISQSRTKRGK